MISETSRASLTRTMTLNGRDRTDRLLVTSTKKNSVGRHAEIWIRGAIGRMRCPVAELGRMRVGGVVRLGGVGRQRGFGGDGLVVGPGACGLLSIVLLNAVCFRL